MRGLGNLWRGMGRLGKGSRWMGVLGELLRGTRVL